MLAHKTQSVWDDLETKKYIHVIQNGRTGSDFSLLESEVGSQAAHTNLTTTK